MQRPRFSTIRVALLAAGVLSITTLAHASAITIFNTGVDAGGVSLTDGTLGDPHYTLFSVPGGTTVIRVRTSAGGYPIPPYTGDSATSAWIGPNNDGAVDGPVGLYDYQTTFDLTGLNPSTASIGGLWASDNNAIDILINGFSTGQATGFASFSVPSTPFSIGANFVAGINTLDFLVINGGGPTALRVEGIHGTADPLGKDGDQVPEPTSLVLLGTGLIGAWRGLKKGRAS